MEKRRAARAARAKAVGKSGTTGAGFTTRDKDDSRLPPSSRALPMVLENGALYPTVAFGKAAPVVPADGSSQDSNGTESKSATSSIYSQQSPRGEKYKLETDLEKLWRVETDRVEQTFAKAQRNLYNTTSSESQDKISSRKKKKNNSMIDYRARVTMDNVMEDIEGIVAAVRKAGANAENQFDNESDDENEEQPAQVTDPESTPKSKAKDGDESMLVRDEELKSKSSGGEELDTSTLLCEEEITTAEDRKALSGDAVRELTILATQEAALIRELAGVIRRKTAEMAEKRLRLVEDAKGKGE